MKKSSILYTAFVLVTILGVADFIGLSLHLYWTTWWFDMVMHFLGGLSLGFLSLYLFYNSKIFFVSFFFAVLLGGVWEVSEYVNDIIMEPYFLDMTSDLIFDTLGALTAILIMKWSLKSS